MGPVMLFQSLAKVAFPQVDELAHARFREMRPRGPRLFRLIFGADHNPQPPPASTLSQTAAAR